MIFTYSRVFREAKRQEKQLLEQQGIAEKLKRKRFSSRGIQLIPTFILLRISQMDSTNRQKIHQLIKHILSLNN